MTITSKITNQTYNDFDVVCIVNLLQLYKYLENGARLLDVYCGFNERVVFVFSKSETHRLKKLWDEHRL